MFSSFELSAYSVYAIVTTTIKWDQEVHQYRSFERFFSDFVVVFFLFNLDVIPELTPQRGFIKDALVRLQTSGDCSTYTNLPSDFFVPNLTNCTKLDSRMVIHFNFCKSIATFVAWIPPLVVNSKMPIFNLLSLLILGTSDPISSYYAVETLLYRHEVLPCGIYLRLLKYLKCGKQLGSWRGRLGPQAVFIFFATIAFK